MARLDYEARRAARIDRLHARAEKARTESASAEQQARRMADVIPLGQPILVGHHSEGRDRRYRDRIHRTFQRAHEAGKQAATLERRAATAESNRAISSDDPNAPDRIRERIATLEQQATRAKTINASLRRVRGNEAAERAILSEAGLSERAIGACLHPGDGGPVGFPAWALANGRAEIRRLHARLETIEANELREQSSQPEVYGDVRLEQADNRVQLFFPGKPDETVRRELKSRGFRRAPSTGAWQRQASEQALYWGRRIAQQAAGAEAAPTEAP